MKEIYEAPVLRLVGFRAAQNLASDWQWDLAYSDNGDSADSTGSGVDIEYPSNPEGDFN